MAKTDEQPVKAEKKEHKGQKEQQLPCVIRHFTLITRVTAILVIAGTEYTCRPTTFVLCCNTATELHEAARPPLKKAKMFSLLGGIQAPI